MSHFIVKQPGSPETCVDELLQVIEEEQQNGIYFQICHQIESYSYLFFFDYSLTYHHYVDASCNVTRERTSVPSYVTTTKVRYLYPSLAFTKIRIEIIYEMSRGDSVLRTNVTKLKRVLFLFNINIELLVFFSSLILKLFEPNRRTKETEAEKWAGLSYEIMN